MNLPNPPGSTDTPEPRTQVTPPNTEPTAPPRRWLRILAIVIGLLLVAAAVAAIWLPRLVDVRIVVDTATKAVQSSTGRSLVIKGPVSVQLWPRLSVVAEDVTFGNAAWAADPEMATARRVALSLDWTPLLHQSVSINRVVIDGLTLNLQPADRNVRRNDTETAAGNWVLTPEGADSSSNSAFNLDKILLQDATIRLRDSSGSLTHTFMIGRVSGVTVEDGVKFKGQDALIQQVDRDGAASELLKITQASGLVSGVAAEFNGQVVWRQQAIDLKGSYEYPDNKASSLTLAVNAKGLDFSRPLSGNKAHEALEELSRADEKPLWRDDRPIDYSMLPKMNVKLDLHAGQVLLPNQAVLPNVVLNASLEETASGRLTLHRFSSGFDKGQITASGALVDYAGNLPAVTVAAKATGFDLAKIFSMQQVHLSGISAQGGAVQLDMALTGRGRSPQQLMASLNGHVDIKVGKGSLVDQGVGDRSPVSINLNSFAGRADLKPGASPQLALDLNATKLDLDPHHLATATEQKAVKGDGPKTGRRWLFGTEPLGFASLPLMNGRIGLNVTELVLPDGIVLPNFLLKASLQDSAGGSMKVDQFKSGFGDGVLVADGLISQYTSASPTLRLRGHARNFRLDRLLAQVDEAKAFGQVKGGEGEFAFHLEGQGASLRSLVSGLNGELQLSLNSATIPHALVDSAGDFVITMMNAVNPLRSKSTVTELQCVSAYLPVRGGQVSINNSVGIATDQLNIILDGQVDLKQERMQIDIQTAQKSGLTTGVNPAGLVVVQGTLLNPSLGINKTGVVKQAATVGLAVVTSGLSLAAQNLLSVATNKNPCQNILKPWPNMDAQLMSSSAN